MLNLSPSRHDPISILLTLPQAASNLAVSRRTLERLIAAGDFPAPVKIGRASRIPQTDLAAYLEKICLERGAKAGAS
ncbi:MAG TPA: helix-turn-helix domain-containing protein [Opitutaceae bacterium]|nr:helix-turn-helix domain-containing protein [Opitutaceae bacterium]